MAQASDRPQHRRPLSPHLQVYHWGPHMAASIFHRATGTILALVGIPLLLWFLLAIAGGKDSFELFNSLVFKAEDGDTFGKVFNILARIAAVVVSWAFFQHLLSGLRHLVLDTGAGYELRTNRFWATAVFAGALGATLLLWVYIFFVRTGA